MNFHFWLIPFLTLFMLTTYGCSTKTTLSPIRENVSYKIHPLRDLPPPVEARAKQMKNEKITKNDNTPTLSLFYTNNTNYVLITSGRKPTGGYNIMINRIYHDKNGVTIYAKDVAPPKGAMVEQVITAPLLVISIPENRKAVRLLWE